MKTLCGLVKNIFSFVFGVICLLAIIMWFYSWTVVESFGQFVLVTIFISIVISIFNPDNFTDEKEDI